MSTPQPLDVLLVEDDPNDLKLTLHAFRKYHLANVVHVARDGAEALEFVFRTGRHADRPGGHPHLILLDLKLPLMDGIEVLRRLKESPVSRFIPIVVLTSSREDKDLTACYELGVNSYIVKPVDFGQFGEVVRQLGFYWLLINQPPPG
ncbi:response regulator [Gemmata sp. JC717]|uniref:Response regulator n=1 Tax=Gemmata algarum TaxID=2975278 RepID=A0ABU5EYW2_9BACT|nr:response regulator [Gemmata algarum]MDY3551538.1 response regulator [Gemmata algarum]MDY3560424.1 response regulator [Gemmata algarum]